MRKKIELKLQNLILLILVPVLLLVILLFAIFLYFNLNNLVLMGFDSKNKGISTVVSSFISADDFEELIKFEQYRGIAFNSKENCFYVNTYNSSDLKKIDLVSRKVEKITISGNEVFEDLTFDERRQRILSVCLVEKDDSLISQLVEIDLKKQKVRFLAKFNEPIYSLAYDSSRDLFYLYGDRLLKINAENYKINFRGVEKKSGIRGLAYNTKSDELFAIDTGEAQSENRLYQISLPDGHLQSSTALLYSRDQQYDFGVFGLLYNGNENCFYGTTTLGIITFKANNLVVTDFEILDNENYNIRKKNSYYVKPMKEIVQKCDLTYLILGQMVRDGRYVNYVVDTDQTVVHGYNGYIDPTASEEGMRDLWLKGDLYISDMKWWDELGWLKSAYTPFFDKKGNVVGFAGSDVNISIIEKKKREILIGILIIAVCAILLLLFISIFISRRLIKPLELLNEMAIKVSSGNFGTQIVLHSPTEIQNLSNRFNKTSYTIKNTIEELVAETNLIESDRRAQEIIKILKKNFPEENKAFFTVKKQQSEYINIKRVCNEDFCLILLQKNEQEKTTLYQMIDFNVLLENLDKMFKKKNYEEIELLLQYKKIDFILISRNDHFVQKVRFNNFDCISIENNEQWNNLKNKDKFPEKLFIYEKKESYSSTEEIKEEASSSQININLENKKVLAILERI